MNQSTLLKVENISKKYTLENKSLFSALSDISFELSRGESIGIIGRNGSGKSTLLKIISGLIKPTAGQVEIHAKVNSLIEIGSNFIPDLSGRANIIQMLELNGIAKADIPNLVEAIIEFSELGQFIEHAIKHYSSGMFVRLAIATGFHINAEIFVIDEVLMAGDEAFRRRVSNHFKKLQSQGIGLLLASHNPKEITDNCTKVLWLEEGKIKFFGDSEKGIRAYYESLAKSYSEDRFSIERPEFYNTFSDLKSLDKKFVSNENLEIVKLEIGAVNGEVSYENGFEIQLNYKIKNNNYSYFPFFKIYDLNQRAIVVINSSNDKEIHSYLTNSQKLDQGITCKFPKYILGKGTYYLELMIGKNPKKEEKYTEEAFKLNLLLKFEINQKEYDYTGDTHTIFVKPKCAWRKDD